MYFALYYMRSSKFVTGHKATAGLEPKIYKAVVQNLDLMKPEAKVMICSMSGNAFPNNWDYPYILNPNPKF